MARRRQGLKGAGPDTRLDWRDPEMPIIRMGREIDHNKLHRHCTDQMFMSAEPHWARDRTYHLSRRRQRPKP